MGGNKPTSSSNRSQSSGNTRTNNRNQSSLDDLPDSEESSGGGGSSGGSGVGGGIGGFVQEALLDKREVDQETRSRSEKQVERAYYSYSSKRDIPDYKFEEVAKEKEKVGGILAEELEIIDDHMFGSMTRGTVLAPLEKDSDADIMFVLNRDAYENWLEEEKGAEEALNTFKEIIESEGGNRIEYEEIFVDRNVVSIQFEDHKMEIAPAFEHDHGGYVIPDTKLENRSWIRTAPRTYKRMFDTVDRNHGGNLRKAARAVKSWSKNHDVPVRSYHLEAITFRHMRSFNGDVPVDEFMEDLFIRLPEYLGSSFNDPAIEEELLDDYLDDKQRRSAIKDAQKAREVARISRQKKRDGKGREAIEDLKELYGDEFGDE